jgi:hypothetical protein
MTTYVIRDGKLVDKQFVFDVEINNKTPYVISDSMEMLRHMATGKYFTSKSEFRKETKAAGCQEIGNDSSLYKPRKLIPLSREQRREDIKRSIYEIRNGRKG